jgi:bifunctional non-homologous end joining protein LigD
VSDVVTANGHAIEITHPDKAMFERPRVTKRDLVRHYEEVAAAMAPHIRGRPLALESYPRGTAQPGFFLKSIPSHFPSWIDRAEIPKKGGSLTQIVGGQAAALVFLAGQNVVTPHIWLARADALRQPDRLIIDLDPSPGIGFAAVRSAARAAGEHLRADGLVPYAMVTGSRGIHVVCPLRRGPSFPDVHAYVRALAERMVAENPRQLTLEWRRSDRGPRIYLDVNRINYAQHAVAPYAVRPRDGAPVAMPIHWDELEDRRLTPDRWTIRTAARRLADEGDAWKGIARRPRGLPNR